MLNEIAVCVVLEATFPGEMQSDLVVFLKLTAGLFSVSIRTIKTI